VYNNYEKTLIVLMVSLNRIIKLCISSSHSGIVRGSRKAVLCLGCGCIRYIVVALELHLNNLLSHVLYSILTVRPSPELFNQYLTNSSSDPVLVIIPILP
jgi:hypothetical protein